MSIIKNWIFNFEEKNEKNKPFSLFLLLMEVCKTFKNKGKRTKIQNFDLFAKKAYFESQKSVGRVA